MTACPFLGPKSDLVLRVIWSVLLAPVVLAATIFGGMPFAVLVLGASVLVLEEWLVVLGAPQRSRLAIAGALALIAATVAFLKVHPLAGLAAVGCGVAAVAALAPAERRLWQAAGVLYAATLLLGALAVRHDPALGCDAIFFLLAVVWATDTAAYFTGRALGGPKLAPTISPNKTWSGAIGGALAGLLAGVAIAAVTGHPPTWSLAGVALAMSIAGQIGDLFESRLKRKFGVKDSGTLIPGHGGLMDRLDGVIAALAFLVAFGLLRGAASVAAGALVW